MKRKIYSLLVSILFFPFVVISQGLAELVLTVIKYIFMYFFWSPIGNVPQFPFNFIVHVFSTNTFLGLFEGCFAGCIAAFVVTMIYKKYHLVYTMIIPTILTILIVGGGFILPILYNKSFIWLPIISNTLVIVSYYYVLKAKEVLDLDIQWE
jgi:hypothetical protein